MTGCLESFCYVIVRRLRRLLEWLAASGINLVVSRAARSFSVIARARKRSWRSTHDSRHRRLYLTGLPRQALRAFLAMTENGDISLRHREGGYIVPDCGDPVKSEAAAPPIGMACRAPNKILQEVFQRGGILLWFYDPD